MFIPPYPGVQCTPIIDKLYHLILISSMGEITNHNSMVSIAHKADSPLAGEGSG
jgi:hypothetical protein